MVIGQITMKALPYIAAGLTASFIAPDLASDVLAEKENPRYTYQDYQNAFQKSATERYLLNANARQNNSLKNLMNTPDYQEAYRAGNIARSEGKGLIENPLGFAQEQIPGIGAIESIEKAGTGQRKFVSAAAQELRNRGYSADKANSLANFAYRDYVARSSSEIPSALAGEVGAEMIGRTVLRNVLPAAVERAALKRSLLNPLARAGTKSSFVAGGYEGALSIINQDISAREFGISRRTILPYGFKKGGTAERFAAQLERVGLGGAFGAGLAAGFGGVISGQRIPRRNVSRGAEFLGNIADPGEYPGDVIASAIAKRKGIKDPTVRLIGLPDEIPRVRTRTTGGNALVNNFQRFMNANTQGRSATQSRGKASTYIPGFSRGNTPANVPSKPGSQVPGFSKEIFPGGKASSKSNSRVPGDTPSETEARANASSTVPTESYASVPASSVIYRGGVPLPLPFPPPQEGGSYISGGNQRAYINELRRGAKLFRRLI